MNVAKSNVCPNFDRQIEVIMSQFDFDRVYRCMILMDWKYYIPHSATESNPDGDRETPTFEQIKKSARQALELVVDQYHTMQVVDGLGGGGFSAGVNEFGELTLSFVIEGGHYVTAELDDVDYFGVR